MHSDKPCSDCYRLFSNYGEKTVDLPPFSCAWCGSSSGVKHHSTVPSRYGKYDFCAQRKNPKEKSCFSKYGDFVYSRTLVTHNSVGALSTGYTLLKNGLPYYITKVDPNENSETMLRCCYCGDVSTSVIVNVCMPKGYKFNTFCRNNVCCSSYVRYVDAMKSLPKVPHVFENQVQIE
jgi:hypothetical protein